MKYTNSNITLEEFIRLNDIREPVVLEAADTIIEQEEEISILQDKIEDYEKLVDSLDVESIESIIFEIMYESPEERSELFLIDRLKELQTLVDNYKERKNNI